MSTQHKPDLPPLPEPGVTVRGYGAGHSTSDGDGGLFTAEQLRAYAAPIAAERDRLRSEMLAAKYERDGAVEDAIEARTLNAQLLEALERAERKLTAYVGVCSGDKELTEAVLPMSRAAIAAARAAAGVGKAMA